MSNVVVVLLLQKKVIVRFEDSHWFTELSFKFLLFIPRRSMQQLPNVFSKKSNGRQLRADCTPRAQSVQ